MESYIFHALDFKDQIMETFKKGNNIGESCGIRELDGIFRIRPGYFYTFTGWPGCFAAGQMVHTRRGVIPIDQIKVGDYVLSFNHLTKCNEYRIVTATPIHKKTKQRLFKVTLKDGTILKVTEDHKFFSGGKYVKIKNILASLGHGKMG